MRTIRCALLVLALASTVRAQDSDSDGMSDSYENFFGLDPTNAADAALDADADGLTNVTESTLWTDPFIADTDRDGFDDALDDTPLSRAVMYWGEPRFTATNDYFYTGPEWWLGGWKSGGEWETNAWHVSAGDTNAEDRLNIDLDRGLLDTNAVMDVYLGGVTGGVLYVDLYDTNDQVVATNLYGNLVDDGGTDVLERVSVPVGSWGSLGGVSLRRDSGEVRVYQTLLYVDLDGDGLDREQETQMGTSDGDTDSDADTVDDWRETFVRFTDPADSNDVNTVVYADADVGDDGLDGYSATVQSATHGPKGTVQGAISEAVSGDSLHLAGTNAFGSGTFSPGAKSLTLVPTGSVTIR